MEDVILLDEVEYARLPYVQEMTHKGQTIFALTSIEDLLIIDTPRGMYGTKVDSESTPTMVDDEGHIVFKPVEVVTTHKYVLVDREKTDDSAVYEGYYREDDQY